MGYACPVCEIPQRDGEHLAHHLAFTAMIHGDDHETWLEEHAPGWDELSPEELADRIVAHADSAEYEEVFEDTVDRGRPDVEFDTHANHDHQARGDRSDDGPIDTHNLENADPETRAAIEKARELTREMHSDDEDASSDANPGTDDRSETDR